MNYYIFHDNRYFERLLHVPCGSWEQYDFTLKLSPYDWNFMKALAEFYLQNEKQLPLFSKTIAVTPIDNIRNDIEMADEYKEAGSIMNMPSLKKEWGSLGVGVFSMTLAALTKVITVKGTNKLRIITKADDEESVLKFAENLMDAFLNQ